MSNIDSRLVDATKDRGVLKELLKGEINVVDKYANNCQIEF